MAPFTFLKWVLAYSSALLTFLLLLIGHLSQVAEVVSLHLQVEDSAVRRLGRGDQMRIEQVLQVKGCNIRVEMCAAQHTTKLTIKLVCEITLTTAFGEVHLAMKPEPCDIIVSTFALKENPRLTSQAAHFLCYFDTIVIF